MTHRGLSWRQWLMYNIHDQCEQWLATLPRDAWKYAPILQQKIWTPRDSYGWRSL